MIPLLTRAVMAIIAAFTLTMLLGATAIWAAQRTEASVNVNVILWVLFPTMFIVSAFVLEYVEVGSLARALRASMLSTVLAAAGVAVAYALWYAMD